MKKEKKSTLRSLAEGSIICRALDRMSSVFYKKAEDGVIGGAMTADDAVDGKLHSGVFALMAEKLNRSKRVKQTVARGCERSVVLGFFGRVLHGLGCLSLRVYGVFFIFFGIVSTLMTFYRNVDIPWDLQPHVPYVVGIAMLLCGLVMLISGKSFMYKATQSRLFSFLLFSVLGLRPASLAFPTAGTGKAPVAAVLGVIMGLTSYVISPAWVMLAFAALLVLYVILLIPEVGVMLAVIGLCFLPTMLLVALVAYTFLCYLIKLWRGKRTFRFNATDCAVLIFFAFMLCGGVSSVGGGASLQPALVYLCFMLGYFLVVNLIRNDLWIKRCIVSACLGAFAVAGYGVYQNFFGEQDTTWQDTEMFEEISGRVVSTFENPNVLGEYLVMMIPVIFAVMLISKSKAGRLGSFLTLCLACACMVFTWSRGAWLGIMLATLVFFLIYTRKTMALCLAALFLIPFLPLILPETILTRFTSIGDLADSSTSYRVSIWQASVKIIGEYPLTGIGVGTGAFSRVYPLYSLAGIESAPHSHNLFLQTAIEVGVPGLITLLAVIVLFAQGSFSFFKKCKDGDMKSGKLLSLGFFAGMVGVLLQGLTDYIWYNYRLYLMFWLVIGLAEAVRRVSLESEGRDPSLMQTESEVK